MIMAWCTCASKSWHFLPPVSNKLPKVSLKVKNIYATIPKKIIYKMVLLYKITNISP